MKSKATTQKSTALKLLNK